MVSIIKALWRPPREEASEGRNNATQDCHVTAYPLISVSVIAAGFSPLF